MSRLLEILPGTLSWGTLILFTVLSWKLPALVAIFIIIFDSFWVIKTFYLTLHLRVAYLALKENLKTDWRKKLQELEELRITDHGSREDKKEDASLKDTANGNWREIQHLILLPMYKEPYSVVSGTFQALLQSDFPLQNVSVVLGLEERAGDVALQVGREIEKNFGNKFNGFLLTVHPANRPDEIPGKGSNEAWMIKEAMTKLVEPKQIPLENVLVSIFDVDTQVPNGFFSRLTYLFLTVPDRLRVIYQPIPFFINNIYEAPALARVIALSCSFWQMMQQSRPERLTSFSSQSVPLKVLRDVGYWHTNVVSEDSRIFWQCLIHYKGDFRVEPMFYPISMDANAAPSFFQTLLNLYKQQRRWAWGVENTPYLLTEFWRKRKEIPRQVRWYWSANILEGFHSWATNSLMIFALGWLPVMLGGRAFNYTLLSYNLPRVTQYIVSISMIGIASCAVLGVLLLPPKPEWFKKRYLIYFVLQWALIPLVLIVFGSVPALEAQTRLILGGKFRLGFWVTPKSRRES